ncbi:hypothetical protein Tco_1058094 [Tanacetum coccineum]|uniref:Uncharacterized protein n=1 Tax=Tanacetum coccineum TaxID=301880 RepID=A0ABQ5H949_9ASTR
MDTTRVQQKALDDELVAPANRLKIGKSNLRLSSIIKSKEPTLQVALDTLKLTPFYNAFEISTDVPEIYMQEFWVTVSRHHSSFCFKLNGKIHTINIDNFIDILKIYPKFLGQKFDEPPLEEEILSFIIDLRHTGEIKFLSNVNTKPTQASRGKRIKTSAKGDKAAKMKQSATKSKGLTVLSEVALSEADQMKLATKRSKKEFHSSHASGSGDRVDIQSKVPDEQQHTISDDQEKEKEKEKANDDDEVSSDQKVSTPPDYEISDEEENQEDDKDGYGKNKK